MVEECKRMIARTGRRGWRMKLLRRALGLAVCLALTAWRPERAEGAGFWRPIFGSKHKAEKSPSEEGLSGMLIM